MVFQMIFLSWHMCQIHPRNWQKLDDRTGIDPVVEKEDNAHMQLHGD